MINISSYSRNPPLPLSAFNIVNAWLFWPLNHYSIFIRYSLFWSLSNIHYLVIIQYTLLRSICMLSIMLNKLPTSRALCLALWGQDKDLSTSMSTKKKSAKRKKSAKKQQLVAKTHTKIDAPFYWIKENSFTLLSNEVTLVFSRKPQIPFLLSTE